MHPGAFSSQTGMEDGQEDAGSALHASVCSDSALLGDLLKVNMVLAM